MVKTPTVAIETPLLVLFVCEREIDIATWNRPARGEEFIQGSSTLRESKIDQWHPRQHPGAHCILVIDDSKAQDNLENTLKSESARSVPLLTR